MLETMEVPYQILSSDKQTINDEIIQTATNEALKNNSPYAIVVQKDTFSNIQLKMIILLIMSCLERMQ